MKVALATVTGLIFPAHSRKDFCLGAGMRKSEKREVTGGAGGILRALEGLPRLAAVAGETVLEQGSHPGFLVFLVEGSVEVVQDGRIVDHESRPCSVYGELSVLLDEPQPATVRAASAIVLVKITEPLEFFREHPEVVLYVCRMVAERLAAVTRYLVDVRRQFSDEVGHLAMVDKILTTLIHRNPKSLTPERTAIRPDH